MVVDVFLQGLDVFIERREKVESRQILFSKFFKEEKSRRKYSSLIDSANSESQKCVCKTPFSCHVPCKAYQ